MLPSFIIATIFCLIGSFGVFDELIPLGALSSNHEAKMLSVLVFLLCIYFQSAGAGADADPADLSCRWSLLRCFSSGCSGACSIRPGLNGAHHQPEA